MGTQMAPHATSHRAAELKEVKTIRVMLGAEATLRFPADVPVPEDDQSEDGSIRELGIASSKDNGYLDPRETWRPKMVDAQVQTHVDAQARPVLMPWILRSNWDPHTSHPASRMQPQDE